LVTCTCLVSDTELHYTFGSSPIRVSDHAEEACNA
jgi:hypothetical protein